MSDPYAHALVEELLPDATRRLIRTADGLTDDEYAAPSGLAGWTRGHVVAHLTLNAEALTGALAGIAEGQRVPMYPSQEQRDLDIDELTAGGPSVIRDRFLGATTDLVDAFAALPHDQWDIPIDRVPGGTSFGAGQVLGMRLREVEVHHADLAAGYGPADWSPAFAGLLLDAMQTRGVSDEPFLLQPSDLERAWTFGDGGPVLTGTGADLGWWLTGRGDGSGVTSDSGTLPRIGTW